LHRRAVHPGGGLLAEGTGGLDRSAPPPRAAWSRPGGGMTAGVVAGFDPAGREARPPLPAGEHRAGAAPSESPSGLLEVEHLTVAFDGFRAVDDLSLSVERDELRVIIGPNGAGKTTLLDMICGKTRPNGGSIHF